MYPHLPEVVAAERMRDRHREAARHRLARRAIPSRGTPSSRSPYAAASEPKRRPGEQSCAEI